MIVSGHATRTASNPDRAATESPCLPQAAPISSLHTQLDDATRCPVVSGPALWNRLGVTVLTAVYAVGAGGSDTPAYPSAFRWSILIHAPRSPRPRGVRDADTPPPPNPTCGRGSSGALPRRRYERRRPAPVVEVDQRHRLPVLLFVVGLSDRSRAFSDLRWLLSDSSSVLRCCRCRI